MSRYISFQYLSPISKYNFDDGSKILMTIVNTSLNDNILCYKIDVKELNNVTSTVRGYPVQKSIQLPLDAKDNYSIRIFKVRDNTLYLIFTGESKMDTDVIRLVPPPAVLGKLRNSYYNNDDNLLDEQFYNFDNIESLSHCLLFYKRTIGRPPYAVITPLSVNINTSNYTWVYNRYVDNIIREYVPDDMRDNVKKNFSKHVVKFMNNFQPNTAYTDYIKKYYIDTSIFFDPKINTNMEKGCWNMVNQDNRPLFYLPNNNNIITSPTDGRTRGFIATPEMTMSFFDDIYTIKELISKPFQIDTGGCFITRVAPQDYNRVYIPYSAHLRELGIRFNKNVCIMTMKFESSYFMPHSVSERDYLSLTNGNFTNSGWGAGIGGTRNHPEFLQVQPDTTLIYHLVLIVPTINDNMPIFTNEKLISIQNKLHQDQPIYKIPPIWMDKGEELARLSCGGGYVCFITNRPVSFSPDINYYSKIIPNDNKLIAPIDTYVKANDNIGILE